MKQTFELKIGLFAIFTLFLLFALQLEALSQPVPFEKIQISDQSLMKMVDVQVPTNLRQHVQTMGAKISQSEFDQDYDPKVTFDNNYSKTREKGLTQFVPVFTPIKYSQVAVSKKFQHGINAKFGFSVEQRSSESLALNDATTDSLFLTLEMDLWKDFLGRYSRAKKSALNARTRQAMIEQKINLHTFKLQVRNVYWNMVANQESRKINEELLQVSKKQLKDAKRRLRNSISDKSEVARYQAQVASREASLVFLGFQWTSMVKQLKTLMPALSEKEITLGDYNVAEAVQEVLSCTQEIESYSKTPLQFTSYDELLTAVREEKQGNLQANAKYSDIDLKLYTTISSKGVDSAEGSDIGSAWADQSDNDRMGYSFALGLTVPLGSNKQKSKGYRMIRDQYAADAKITDYQTRISASHEQLLNSVKYLLDATKLQIKTTDALKIRLEEVQKKYNQARVSVTELVADQDAYFNANLAVIDTRLKLLNVLFEYFAVFTETPCKFNRS